MFTQNAESCSENGLTTRLIEKDSNESMALSRLVHLIAAMHIATAAPTCVRNQDGTVMCGGTMFPNGVLNVCTTPGMPYVACNQTAQIFHGYEVDLFRETAYRMQMLEMEDYRFTCWDWDDMAADILKNLTSGRTCDLTAACQIMGPENDAAGMHFQLPSLSTGLAIAFRSLSRFFLSVMTFECSMIKGRNSPASMMYKSCSLNSLRSQ